MGVLTLFVMFIYIAHIEATYIMPDYSEDGFEEITPENKHHFIIVVLPNVKRQNKELQEFGLRQGSDPKVVDFFPFCGEACIDLEGKCDINRADCYDDPTPCRECDASKRKCKEKCLNIVNYH